MKVYVIQQGVYSDKRTLGVVSSLEGHEGLLAMADTRAIPMELDAIVKIPPGHNLYEVSMNWDGNEAAVNETDRMQNPEDDYRVWTEDHSLSRVVAATDETHAVKIVNEERAMLLAQRAPKGPISPR
jgi:hypothetical protein